MRAAETAFLCRQAAAELFQAESPEQVVFTSNATHGLNLAIHSLLKPGDAVVISGYEHNAVTRPLHALGVNIRVAAGPLFDPEAQVRAFERQLDETVRAVICNHVSNVFGFILPVEGIAALCRERGIPFVLDASQSAGCLPVHMGSWAQPLSPCRDTRDFTVPRAPACCSAGRRPTHYSWAAPEAPRRSRPCPISCPTAWRQAPTTCPALPACWRDFVMFRHRGRSVF